jgi:hypothetical protein
MPRCPDSTVSNQTLTSSQFLIHTISLVPIISHTHYSTPYSTVVPEKVAQKETRHSRGPKGIYCCPAKGEERAKSYHSVYSIILTGLTTKPPLRCSNRAERTESPDVMFYFHKDRNVGFPTLLRRRRKLACWICGSEPRCDKLSNSPSRRA